MTPENATQPRRLQLFERRATTPRYELQPRDAEIVKQVFRHRFLQVRHLGLLIGGNPRKLAERCRLLFQAGFLERPRAQQPLAIQTEPIIYGLGPKAVELLRRSDPNLRDLDIEWVETPKKQRTSYFLGHQLGVAEFFVCLQAAAAKAGLELSWQGHYDLKNIKFTIGKEARQPDGFFTLRDPKTKREMEHFLEFDRGNVSLARMRDRYDAYFRFWREGKKQRPFEHFRVLTVAPDESHRDALRRASSAVGTTREHGRAWWGLWFTHQSAYNLAHPEELLKPIFRHAYEAEPRSLLDRQATTA